MKMFVWLGTAVLGLTLTAFSQDVAQQARKMETGGDAAGARALLERAVQGAPRDAATILALAEFLDRHNDPARSQTYEKALAAFGGAGNRERRAAVARRLVILDLVAGERAAATRHLEEYRAAGGSDLPASVAPARAPAGDRPTIDIPGPLRSFARMAALSPDLQPDDVMGALARNVVTNGYQASSGNEALDQTEYLKLVVRYLSQARELERLAGASKTIRIETCESSQTAELLRIVGYRMRGACGSEVVLETVNATRAFLTIDSGFPLSDLEQALRTNRPFTYDYQPTRAPLLYPPDYWLGAKPKAGGEFIDNFLGDPALCRLYLGLSKLDKETAGEIRKSVSVQRVKAFAHVLDFYGAMFEIRGGKAVVPGGARSAKAWADLVGVAPDQGAAFFERLISKDDGWMASFFDALARIHGPVEQYLTEPERMKRFYMAVRGRVTSPGPARPVFRANTDMMLLTTRLRLEADGRPHIPGTLEIWKNLFIKHPHGKYDGKLTRMATTWKEPDDVVEALFALCRKAVENEPLKIFMALSDVDRRRAAPLEAATVDRLAREFRFYSAQYAIFNESPAVRDSTMLLFLDTAQAINQIRDQGVRADAAGLMQSLVGLWQIFTRQESIPPPEVDGALAGILTPFGTARNSRDLFDAGRQGANLLLKAAHTKDGAPPQDRLIDLLAGAGSPADVDTHSRVVQDMIRIFESQRLMSLNVLFELDDNLASVSQGQKLNTALVNRLAARIAEIQLPRTGLSGVEKNAMSFGYWTERHLDAQRKLNLRAVVEKSANAAEKLKETRGLLTPFLRDTLVGLNYLHYAPPGAQILLTNPLFVRGHDFLGVQGGTQTWRQTEVFGTGWPASAGGRLVGSLAELPYALAEAEQNFLIPSREQALIWGDLVPQMILSAKIPRWWNAEPAQQHWVGLHMRFGESLVAEAALNAPARRTFIEAFERQAAPARVSKVNDLLDEIDVRAALDNITPAELYAVAAEVLTAHQDAAGPLAQEIRSMAAEAPQRINYGAISRLFGTPKPTLTNSYRPELLLLRTFPTLMGYSSRIMAESWESTIIYWASLADELQVAPSQLNILVPEWTQQMVERIFATHLEDWPAVLRSMRVVAEDARAKMRRQASAEQKASLN